MKQHTLQHATRINSTSSCSQAKAGEGDIVRSRMCWPRGRQVEGRQAQRFFVLRPPLPVCELQDVARYLMD